jgi:hypothetical protein
MEFKLTDGPQVDNQNSAGWRFFKAGQQGFAKRQAVSSFHPNARWHEASEA